MYEQQQQTNGAEDQMAMAPDDPQIPADADVVEQKREPLPDPPREVAGSSNQPGDDTDGSGVEHGECCEECKKTCKRNFWTEVLRAVVKISTIVLAAFGIQSFGTED